MTAQTEAQKLFHPAGNFIQINGKRIWYESEGNGEPLILISGGPGFSHAYFHPFFSGLADSYRVIYFDAFGTGKSDRAITKQEYSLAAAVEDLEGFRTGLKLEKVNVLGHSYGGFVAQIYALKYPNSVKQLILANTLAGGKELQTLQDKFNDEIRNQLPEVWEKIQELRTRGLLSASKEHQEVYAMPPTFSYFYNPENVRRLPRSETDLYNPDLWYAMGGDDADFVVKGEIARFDVQNELKRLKMPILVLAGRFDRMVPPRITVNYKKLAPQAEFVMFEKSGHFPFIEETDKTLSVLRIFLSKKM
ncbi:MAG: alpha/beta hydrolase [Acidobacteriota bacterium]|nr:alpha/beta hydrolase [Acidobacteriota bacterium]